MKPSNINQQVFSCDIHFFKVIVLYYLNFIIFWFQAQIIFHYRSELLSSSDWPEMQEVLYLQLRGGKKYPLIMKCVTTVKCLWKYRDLLSLIMWWKWQVVIDVTKRKGRNWYGYKLRKRLFWYESLLNITSNPGRADTGYCHIWYTYYNAYWIFFTMEGRSIFRCSQVRWCCHAENYGNENCSLFI